MKRANAQLVREYGPFPGVERVNGVTFDGAHVWFASGDKLNALDPETGSVERAIETASHAGTAFDGTHLWQIADDRILKINPEDGRVVSAIPAPGAGASGMAWAEGVLWVGEYRARRIHQVDPETGRVLKSIQSDRFVTGVSWMAGELWHATWEADRADIRHVNPTTGETLETLDLPAGVGVSGMESNGRDTIFCGGAGTAKVLAVKRRR